MKCILLKNYEKGLQITEDEKFDFQRVILNGIATCDNLYLLTLNSSKTDAFFILALLS